MDWDRYVSGIAEARFAIRKVFRIVDLEAKNLGLEPLEHQTLIQVEGAPGQPLQVRTVAERLDISAALASRMLRGLESRGLVTRQSSPSDRRVTEVTITASGRETLRRIDADVRSRVTYFQSQLPEESKVTALSVMAFYVGLDVSEEGLRALLGHESEQ